MKRFNRTMWLDLQAHERGALGVTLLKGSLSRRSSRNIVEDFVAADLEIETTPDLMLDFRPNLQEVESDGRVLQWRPDVALVVRNSFGGSVIARYLVEVKTGRYADFRHQQKETMQQLAHEGEKVLAIWVYLDEMPDKYGIRIRKMGEYIN